MTMNDVNKDWFGKAERKKAYAAAISIVKDPDQADECAQETYVRIQQRRTNNPEPIQDLKSYIVTVAKNTAREWLKRNKKTDGSIDDHQLSVEESTPNPGALTEVHLENYLAKLLSHDSERFQTLLRESSDLGLFLWYLRFHGVTYAVIQQLTGLSSSTADSRVKVFRERDLKQLLCQWAGDLITKSLEDKINRELLGTQTQDPSERIKHMAIEELQKDRAFLLHLSLASKGKGAGKTKSKEISFKPSAGSLLWVAMNVGHPNRQELFDTVDANELGELTKMGELAVVLAEEAYPHILNAYHDWRKQKGEF